jgi:hypothetical protein
MLETVTGIAFQDRDAELPERVVTEDAQPLVLEPTQDYQPHHSREYDARLGWEST